MVEVLGCITFVLVDIYLAQKISDHVRERLGEKQRLKEQQYYEVPPSSWGKEF
jgi:hypothetical protein